VLGGRNLTEGNAEVVGIIEGVHQILVWAIVSPSLRVAELGKRTYGRDECPGGEEIHRG
jgi:hypothetical protein